MDKLKEADIFVRFQMINSVGENFLDTTKKELLFVFMAFLGFATEGDKRSGINRLVSQ